MTSPSSGSKNKPSKIRMCKPVARRVSFETLVDFQRTTERYIPDDIALQNFNKSCSITKVVIWFYTFK
jgi:hypothetical protein